MRTLYFTLVALIFSQFAKTQVNLPHTLVFQNNDNSNWSDGIANDGDGGSANINGIDLEIFTATAGFSFFPGSTIRWDDNGTYYYSSDPGYHGITSGPDLYVTNNGVPAMVMRSTNPAINFSLESIRLYDWGGNTPLMASSYDNGILIGTIEVDFDMINFDPKTISQADELISSFFDNIDEVRFYPKSPNTVLYLSLNNIALDIPNNSTLPVKLEYFTARQETGNNRFFFEWATSSEENSSHFEIEKSTNGTDFTLAGRIQASGNTAESNSYDYSLDIAIAPVYYFRLRQVDIDGKEYISSIVRLETNTFGTITSNPNPSSGNLNIESTSGNIKTILLYNSSGIACKTLYQVNKKSCQLDISDLPTGTYFLQVVINDRIEKQIIVKK